MGPKPSVVIELLNMGDAECYGTLLSEKSGTGPASAWNGEEDGIRNFDVDVEIWEKFVNYKDSDGYYYLQETWHCSETKLIDWTYYPPDPFKILLYYPESDTFYVSGIYEKYAFDSYFSVDMSKVSSENPTLIAEKSYNYGKEIISFFARVILTLAVELILALIGGYRGKRIFLFILNVNIVTQVLLNIALSIIDYNWGGMMLIFVYFYVELIVFLLEATIYCSNFKKLTEKRVTKAGAIIYAALANFLSFMAGVYISAYLPYIF